MRTGPISTQTGEHVSADYLYANDVFFRDTHGRAVLLRGVNFSGSSKAPIGQQSQTRAGLWEDAESGKVSFIGRPLELDDPASEVHLARLRAWGFNVLRFVFTWEAIEHAGPGKYDQAYIEYLVKVLLKVKEWGFRVFMDPHQDVWSRFSGGDGAPIWTLYAAGIDPHHIAQTQAALVHSEYPSPSAPAPATFPGMVWGTNYTRLISQTMFTLFFAGRTFAPKCIIDGQNIQDWLQGHFISAVEVLVKRLAKEPGLLDDCVIGWDSVNEPGEGLISHEHLGDLKKGLQLRKGPMPTPFQSFKMALGEAVAVDNYTFSQMGPAKAGQVILDPERTKLWLKPEEERTRGGGKWGWKRDPGWKLGECLWAQHGLWDPATGALLKPTYFAHHPKEPERLVDFTQDFFTPHWLAYGKMVRAHHPDAILFVQAPVFHPPPIVDPLFLNGRTVNSAHFYDGLTLMTKHWNWFNADALGLLRGKYWSMVQAIRIGEKSIRDTIQYDLGILKQDTEDTLGKHPTLIGEIGIPYDMDEKRAYGYVEGGRGEGDYSAQQRAFDASLNAADGPNCLNYTMWTYCADNSHEWGDGWNGEDLSIWSPDDERSATVMDDTEPDSSAPPSAIDDPNHDKSFASLASSSTLVSTTAGGRGQKLSVSPASIESGVAITPKLIQDGARALGAFCRPFPVRTVGTPLRIDFEIQSTSFKLSVKVTPGDAVDEGIATEIYLPFAHYAASLDGSQSRTAGGLSGLSTRNASTSSLLKSKANASVHTASVNSEASASAPAPAPAHHHHHHRPHAPHLHLPHSHGKSSTAASPVSTSPVTKAPISTLAADEGKAPVDDGLRLDISVLANVGRTEIQGQYLYWYYPAPDAGEETYTIEIRRNGGPLKRAEEQKVQQGGWGEVCSNCLIA